MYVNAPDGSSDEGNMRNGEQYTDRDEEGRRTDILRKVALPDELIMSEIVKKQ